MPLAPRRTPPSQAVIDAMPRSVVIQERLAFSGMLAAGFDVVVSWQDQEPRWRLTWKIVDDEMRVVAVLQPPWEIPRPERFPLAPILESPAEVPSCLI